MGQLCQNPSAENTTDVSKFHPPFLGSSLPSPIILAANSKSSSLPLALRLRRLPQPKLQKGHRASELRRDRADLIVSTSGAPRCLFCGVNRRLGNLVCSFSDMCKHKDKWDAYGKMRIEKKRLVHNAYVICMYVIACVYYYGISVQNKNCSPFMMWPKTMNVVAENLLGS